MKIPKPFLLLFAAILALGAITPPKARAQVSVRLFLQQSQPLRRVGQLPDYGYCWHPTNVGDDWAPYTDGYWAYTDGGWTWVSYEDYGGIVYHYGRWANIEGEGWVWVPGTTWAPAWVSWRSSDDYVGWAPLPPEARLARRHRLRRLGGCPVQYRPRILQLRRRPRLRRAGAGRRDRESRAERHHHQ